MQHLGLKAKIRVPKRKREVKDSSNICKNYINQNFKNDFSRAKLFTDTTQYKFEFGTVYFSGVVGSCKTLFSLNVSFRNDETLIQKDIKEATRKVGRKYIIQFDNAAFYKNKNMIKLIEKTNGIRSYSYPGKCLDNRPIEYQWSILKQEYFKHINPKSLEELKGMLQKILFHYNHVRIQKKLDWKTPAKARV